VAGNSWQRARAPVTSLAPIATITATSPHPVAGYGVALFRLLFLPWAISVATFGSPLALLGRHLTLDE